MQALIVIVRSHGRTVSSLPRGRQADAFVHNFKNVSCVTSSASARSASILAANRWTAFTCLSVNVRKASTSPCAVADASTRSVSLANSFAASALALTRFSLCLRALTIPAERRSFENPSRKFRRLGAKCFPTASQYLANRLLNQLEISLGKQVLKSVLSAPPANEAGAAFFQGGAERRVEMPVVLCPTYTAAFGAEGAVSRSCGDYKSTFTPIRKNRPMKLLSPQAGLN